MSSLLNIKFIKNVTLPQVFSCILQVQMIYKYGQVSKKQIMQLTMQSNHQFELTKSQHFDGVKRHPGHQKSFMCHSLERISAFLPSKCSEQKLIIRHPLTVYNKHLLLFVGYSSCCDCIGNH